MRRIHRLILVRFILIGWLFSSNSRECSNSFRLATGGILEFMLNDKNEILTKPVSKKAKNVAGLLRQYKKAKPLSLEEMNRRVGQLFKGFKQ